MAEVATPTSTMSEEEIKIVWGYVLNYCLDLFEKLPSEVKDNILQTVVTSLSTLFKSFETYKMAKFSAKALDICPKSEKITAQANVILCIGIAIEVINFCVQLYRLTEFIGIVGKASNIRDESRKKLNKATDALKEVAKLIQDFDEYYGVHFNTLTVIQIYEMIKMKDLIYNKLNEVKEDISQLEFKVGNQIKILQMERDTLLMDSISGGISGTLSAISSCFGEIAGVSDPAITLFGFILGLSRVYTSKVAIGQYKVSDKILSELQVELINIKKLSDHHKALKECFTELCNSISFADGEIEGTYKIVIKKPISN